MWRGDFAGAWSRAVIAPGSKLPSLADSAPGPEVSAIAVRQRAARVDAGSGWSVGHQGLGVFVKERGQIHRVLAGSPQRSIGEEISRAGFKARLQEISYTEFRADAETAQYLRVRRGARMFRHEKMTYADDDPVAYHIVTLSADLARRLRPMSSADYFLWALVGGARDIATASMRCEFQRGIGWARNRARLVGAAGQVFPCFAGPIHAAQEPSGAPVAERRHDRAVRSVSCSRWIFRRRRPIDPNKPAQFLRMSGRTTRGVGRACTAWSSATGWLRWSNGTRRSPTDDGLVLRADVFRPQCMRDVSRCC